MKLSSTLFLNKHYNYILFSITFIGLFSACKEYTVLPPDLVPPIDNISTFQDVNQQLITNTIYQDSFLTGGIRNGIRIANNPTFYHAIGTIEQDAVFGLTTGASHIEVVPPTSNFNFRTQLANTNRTIDSIVLSVPYVTLYGDSINSARQTFNVYRSLQKSNRDSAQYEFTKDVYNSNEVLGSQTIDFNNFRKDSPLVGTVKLLPQLRFKLSQTFIDSLEHQIDLGASGAAVSATTFLNWCNGFYIKPTRKEGNALGYFNTYGTRLNIYYRYTTTNNIKDTVVDVFSYDPNNCNRFNTIERDYTQSVAKSFINTQSPLGDSVLFVQNEPGLSAVIKFPTLTNFENVIVNKAELIFTQVAPFPFDFNNIYYPMTRMQILQSSDAGNDVFPRDYTLFGATFVDGKQYKTIIGGVTYNQYKFNLTNTFQRVISQKDTTFRLKIMGQNSNIAYPGAYRVLLRGSGSQAANLKPTLNLIYTKLK
jgi:hypothetical protein